jgi:integrase/recombinase XerC
MVEQLKIFLEYLQYQKRYSEHTLLSYENDLTGYFNFQQNTFSKDSYKQTESFMVRSWIVHLSKENYEPRSINRKISALNSFFKYFIRNGEITINPMKHISLLKVSKRLPSFFTEEDMQTAKLILEPDMSEFEILRNKLIIKILYNTGCRKAELISLKITDINFERGEIMLFGKGKKERKIPISIELKDDIQKYISVKNEYFKESIDTFPNLFLSSKGKPMQPKSVYNLVKNQLHLLTTSDKKSPHTLRHSFATHMLNHGADINAIKELLGHASLAATQVYTHNSIERLKEVYEKAHPSANK